MKKLAKGVLLVMLLGIMIFSLTACGVDMSKVKGEWSVNTIDGKDVLSYFLENQLLLGINFTITDNEIITETLQLDGIYETKTYKLERRKNGVQGMEGDECIWGLVLDEETGILTHIGVDNSRIVLEKGKKDFAALLQQEESEEED